jgi:sec-independent protein translocase protein TatA
MAFGPTEMILIAVVVIILFGAKKIPELGKSVGKFTGEFKKGQKEVELEMKDMERSAELKHKKEEEDSKLTKIQKMARDAGLDISGKTDDQLLDEMEKQLDKAATA